LYFCKPPLSSVSSTTPLRILDFWFEDVIIPYTDNRMLETQGWLLGLW
jgi:hypothetical protein